MPALAEVSQFGASRARTALNHNGRQAAGQAWTEERLPRPETREPLGGPATPHQIATTIRFLLSYDASYMTASALMVDRGYTAL